MSVIVKGMEMPKSCSKCRWFDMGGGYGYQCTLLHKSFDMWNKISVARDKECPLIELPLHGRLIDADALINELASEHVGGLEAIKTYTEADTWTSGLHTAWRTIDDADTVIEAED